MVGHESEPSITTCGIPLRSLKPKKAMIPRLLQNNIKKDNNVEMNLLAVLSWYHEGIPS